MFKNYKTRSLIAERLLYEQFGYEVKKSIDLCPYAKNPSDHYTSQEYMNVEAKLDSYYECRDVYDQELNENQCQNQILKNYTCCRSECCIKTNEDEKNPDNRHCRRLLVRCERPDDGPCAFHVATEGTWQR